MSHLKLTAAAALAAAALAALPGSASAASLPAGTTAILSGAPSLFDALPQPVGDDNMSDRAVSEDGRYVAFASTSDGLLDGDDDRVVNIYRKDMDTGDVVLVSRRDGAAGEPAHDGNGEAAISDDGRRVAFVSEGPLSGADANGQQDVYVRDVEAGTTTLVSRVPATGAAGNNRSFAPALDQDGSVVAFESMARDLTNAAPEPPRTGVYRHDLTTGSTVVVSRGDGALGALGQGSEPSITDDGNVIAFTSSTALDPAADTNGTTDIYVRDASTGKTTLASRAPTAAGAVGNSYSRAGRISGNGLAVVFESASSNLDARDKDDLVNIYRRGLGLGTTAVVDVTAAGARGGSAWEPSVDDSGHVISFISSTTVLDPADKDATDDAYVANVLAKTVEVASRADGPAGAAANRYASSTAVSGDAYHVVSLLDGGITPDADPRRTTIVRRSLASRTTRSVSRPAGTAPFANTGGESEDVALSADGRYAAFRSEASGLGLPADARRGIFLRDRVTGAVTLVSRRDGPTGKVFFDVSAPAISADGRRVAFAAADGPGDIRQVWVREPATGRTMLASLTGGGKAQTADGTSGSVTLDADGSRVAFRTQATNLVPEDKDSLLDVVVRDLETEENFLVSRADGAAGAKGDLSSRGPDIDASGTRVSFASNAKNLVAADKDTLVDVFVRDLAAGTTRLVSATPGGVKGDEDAGDRTSIDGSGTRVAFDSTADNLAGASSTDQVFVRDLAAGRLDPVGAGSGAKLSQDGGHVAFSGWYGAALLRDLRGGGTQVVSRHAGADESGRRPYATVNDVSNAGGCVAFETLDAIVGPERERDEAYLRAVLPNCGDAPSPGQEPAGAGDTPAPAPGQAPADAGEGPARPGTGGGASGPIAGQGTRDTVAPILSRVRLGSRHLGRGRATTLRFVTSEAGRLSVAVERRPRSGTRGTPRGRRVGTLAAQIARGAGRLRVGTRIGRRTLTRGRYRLTVTATDAAGNRSRPVRLTLTVR